MLYIKLKGSNHSIPWHVGEKVNIDYHADVEEIQADEDELVHLYQKFDNIPRPTGYKRVVRWFGDMANFIVHNL